MRIRKLMAAVCAVVVLTCAGAGEAAGAGVQADAYGSGPAVIEVDSLDQIPDGYDASRSSVEYVLVLRV